MMRMNIRFSSPVVCLIFVCVIIFGILWLQNQIRSETSISPISLSDNDPGFLVVSNNEEVAEFYRKKCIGEDIGLDSFHKVLDKWSKTKVSSCRSVFILFSTFFYFRKSDSEVVLSDTFSNTVLKWFNNNNDLLEKTKHQYVLVIMNKFTKDGTLMNPLRNKRPGFAGGPNVDKYVSNLVESSKERCDFCNYHSQTGQDVFGYLESKHSVTIANTFKIERFHSLALWKHHNPLEFNEEQKLIVFTVYEHGNICIAGLNRRAGYATAPDLMAIAQKWFKKSFAEDNSFTLPSLLWDILPKASASQIHPHVHMFLSKDHYFSGWEKIFHAAVQYKKTERRNYFNDLNKIHTILRLNISYGDAVAFVSLTPSVSNEVVILSKSVGDNLFKLFYRIMKAFMKMKLYAVTAGAVFPPMTSGSDNYDIEIPCIIRIVNRGAVDKMRSDISSMELFGSGNINVDLWDFRKKIVENIEA